VGDVEEEGVAGSPSSRNGSVPAVGSSDTSNAEASSVDTATIGTATRLIRVPTWLNASAVHSRRKSRLANTPRPNMDGS
jgi:hypothetical protein